MTTFTNQEYTDILIVYGAANCVARLAQRIYQDRYPNRRIPSRGVFQNTYRRMRETGSIHVNEARGHNERYNVEVDEGILALFEEHPTISIREAAAQLNISPWKVWYVLRQNGKHPFHYTPVQGYGSGWDVIVPSGYALPFWLTFIMFGARPGGLRETENCAFEMGECYSSPDSNAGKLEEKRIEREKSEKYFRLPPSKRVNFIKLGIQSPFICPWKILLKDWCSAEQNNTENFFVLRDKGKLNVLQDCIKHKIKPPEILDSFACLVPIYLKLVRKGNLSSHALICAPETGDISNEKTLFEPQHEDYNENIRKEKKRDHLRLLKQIRRKRIKLKRKKVQATTVKQSTQKKKNAGPTEYEKIMRELWVPLDVGNIRHHCSRELIGFITMAGFSFTEAKSCGIGFIPYNALSSLSEKKQNQVLVRNITSRKYRLANIEIIQNI